MKIFCYWLLGAAIVSSIGLGIAGYVHFCPLAKNDCSCCSSKKSCDCCCDKCKDGCNCKFDIVCCDNCCCNGKSLDTCPKK